MKIVTAIIGLLFFVAFSSQAQTKSAEEIITAIENSSSEDSKNHELALLNLNITKNKIAKHYLDIGYTYYKKEDYSRSYYYVDKAIHFANMINDNEILSFAYLRLGNVFLQDWKNQKAIDAYYTSIDYSKTINNQKNERLALINSAIILRRMKEYKKALKTCNKASKFIIEDKNQVNLLTIKSEIYLELEELDSSLYSAEKGIKMGKALNHNAGLIDLYIKKGIVLCLKKEFNNAKDYLNKAEKVINANNIKNKKFIINLNYTKAHCYYEKGEYNKAISQLNTVLPLFGDEIDPRKGHVLNTHLLLSKSYKKVGLIEASEEWYDKYVNLDKKFQLNQAQTISKIYKADNDYLDSKIEALKSDKLKRKKKYTYSLIAFSVGILTLILFLINYKRKQKSNKILFDDLLKKVTALEATEQKSIVSVKEVIIDDAKVLAIIKGLDKLEKQEYYLSYNCNLRAVAKKVKTNATYLSKIINTHKNKNFNDYINDLRIDYTIKRLKNNKQFRSFSIKSIATEVGYKSDYSFAKHFKAKTGFNPSYYIKEIEKLEVEEVEVV